MKQFKRVVRHVLKHHLHVVRRHLNLTLPDCIVTLRLKIEIVFKINKKLNGIQVLVNC